MSGVQKKTTCLRYLICVLTEISDDFPSTYILITGAKLALTYLKFFLSKVGCRSLKEEKVWVHQDSGLQGPIPV